MKKPELTAQILGMYIGRPCDIELRNDYTAIDTDVITPALIGYFLLGDVSVTPHLRRLGSITDDECKECYYLTSGFSWSYEEACKESWWREKDDYYITNHNFIKGVPGAWLFLLSRGFDLFGLIDNGLAKEVSE